MAKNRDKITLETLLRAKRNERPEADFWLRFEREFKGKQKLLIQRQLANETGFRSPFATRIFKLGAFTATCGVAAIAVYLGIQTSPDQPAVAEAKAETSSFSVATTAQTTAVPTEAVGLQESATLTLPNAPRIVVQRANSIAQAPSPSQLSALKTLASLEQTIRASRDSNPAPMPGLQFVSSNGLFETELADPEDDSLEGIWDFENAFLLGKYADPLTGALDARRSNQPIGEIQYINISQLEEALSNQSSRSSRSIDSLTVRF